MPPQIDPVGIELELLFQETQVPLSLVGLIPIIAEMVNGEPRGPDAASAGGDDPVQIRHDRLVNSTLETNARVAPEQAMLRISREPGSRMEADGACTQVWVSELGFQDQAVIYDAAAAKHLGRAAARYGAAGLCRQPDQRNRGRSSETIGARA